MNIPMILMITICILLVINVIVTALMYNGTEQELSLLRNKIGFVNTKTDGIRDREAKAHYNIDKVDCKTAKLQSRVLILEKDVAKLIRDSKAAK